MTSQRARAALRAVRRAGRALDWYVKALLGESDYQRYIDHLACHHPEAPVPTVKQYWRERHARESRQPGARCC
jgi:uncharacterized short protein YbdD (DUF466 family)